MSRFRRFLAAAAAATVVAAVVQAPEAARAAGPNLAAGKPFSASSFTDVYAAGNANDGNARHLLGEHQQRVPAVAPGRPRRRGQRQPGRAQAAAGRAWQTRTQTLTVQGSTNGSHVQRPS